MASTSSSTTLSPLDLIGKFCLPTLDPKKRLAAGTTLCAVLLEANQRQFCQHNFPMMLQHLERTLGDPDPSVRKQMPLVIGALGVSQEPELRGFFAWLADAAQRLRTA